MSGDALMYSVLTIGLVLVAGAIAMVIRSYRRPDHDGLSAALAGLAGAAVLLFLGWFTVGSYLTAQAWLGGGPPDRADPSSAAYREGFEEGTRLKMTTYLTYEDRHDRCYELASDAWPYRIGEIASLEEGCYDGAGIHADDVPALQLDYAKRHPSG